MVSVTRSESSRMGGLGPVTSGAARLEPVQASRTRNPVLPQQYTGLVRRGPGEARNPAT